MDNGLPGLCERFLKEYPAIQGVNNTEMLGKKNGLLEFALSELNMQGVEKIDLDPNRNGTVRECRIRYFQRGTDADITIDTGGETDCEDGEDQFLEKTVNIERRSRK